MYKWYKVKDFIGKKLSAGKNFEYFYNLGVDAYGKQDFEKAIKCFNLAVAQPDLQPQVYYNLGLSYQCLKDYDRAIVAYHRFLAVCHNDYDGMYNLALVYYTKDCFDKAIEFFEKCVEIKKDEDGIKSLTLAFLNNNEVQRAIDFAQNLLDNCPNGTDLYYSVAKVFENKNSFNKDFTYIDKAIEMYLKIIEKNPHYFNAFLAVSICHAKKGELESSVDYCKRALETNPHSYEANNQMGLVYYCCDEIKEAVKYYETALKLKPEGDYKIYSNLGYAYEKIGQYDKAVKVFSQLVCKFSQCPSKDEIKNHMRILKTL